MKKSVKYLLALFLILSLSLFACGGGGEKEATPTEGLTNLLQAFQDQDYAKVQELIIGEAEEEVSFDTLRGLFTSAFGDTNQEKAGELADVMFKRMSEFTYEIKGEKVDGDKATVSLDITNIDLAKAMEDVMTQVMSMDLAEIDTSMPQEEMEAMILDKIIEGLKTSEAMKTESLDVLMEKDAESGQWVLSGDDQNDALMNVLLGNMGDMA